MGEGGNIQNLEDQIAQFIQIIHFQQKPLPTENCPNKLAENCKKLRFFSSFKMSVLFHQNKLLCGNKTHYNDVKT